jgi:hypothetical protein
MYEREPELIRVWGGGVERYYADIEHLMRVALGELANDERSVAVVASVIGPPTFFALEARGLTFDEAVALTLELALPWLEQRRDELAAQGDLVSARAADACTHAEPVRVSRVRAGTTRG